MFDGGRAVRQTEIFTASGEQGGELAICSGTRLMHTLCRVPYFIHF
jgi:hypothetical protein